MSLSNAISYLTVLPIPYNPQIPLNRSVHYFPLVGAGMGSLLLLCFLGFSFVFPPFIAAILAMACLEAAGGGSSLRALAQLLNKGKEEQLSTHDFRIPLGLAGAIGVVVVFVGKVLAVHWITPEWQNYALFLTPIFGRTSQALGLLFCKEFGVSPGADRGKNGPKRVKALVFSLGLLSLVFHFPLHLALGFLIGYLVILLIMYTGLNKRQGGLTVSTLSAASQVSELFFLAACAWLL